MGFLVFALRLGIGGLLVVSGVLKAHDGTIATVQSVAAYRILPPELAAPLGVILPYFEMFLGAYLIIGLFTRIAAYVTAFSFAVFSAAVASAVVRGLSISCGCFGSGVIEKPTWGHVALDLAGVLAALVVAWYAPGAFAVDSRLAQGVDSKAHMEPSGHESSTAATGTP